MHFLCVFAWTVADGGFYVRRFGNKVKFIHALRTAAAAAWHVANGLACLAHACCARVHLPAAKPHRAAHDAYQPHHRYKSAATSPQPSPQPSPHRHIAITTTNTYISCNYFNGAFLPCRLLAALPWRLRACTLARCVRAHFDGAKIRTLRIKRTF